MKKKTERYFAADINGLIYANIVYYKLKKGTLGCYSGFASGVFQLKYFFISDKEVLITDDETEISPDLINNDINQCYELQKHRSEFEFYGDGDDDDGSIWTDKGKTFAEKGTLNKKNHMWMAKTKNFDEGIIKKLQNEWSLQFFLEK